ncbi:MAG TPA: hypothetical protein H9676_01560, partial [Firmicutes bacterium]|nr:hypothetical protein [Bacillota bacterium]
RFSCVLHLQLLLHSDLPIDYITFLMRFQELRRNYMKNIQIILVRRTPCGGQILFAECEEFCGQLLTIFPKSITILGGNS